MPDTWGIDGSKDHQHFSRDIACEGHQMTCGKYAGRFRIVGGLENDDIHGKRISMGGVPKFNKLLPTPLPLQAQHLHAQALQ